MKTGKVRKHIQPHVITNHHHHKNNHHQAQVLIYRGGFDVRAFTIFTREPNGQPLTNMIHWSQHNPTKPNQTTISTLVKSSKLPDSHKAEPSELSELPVLNKHSNAHIQKGRAGTKPSLQRLCTVRDNEEDKTHHINYPANTFFRGPVNHCAETFLRTSAIPVGTPRHSWVLNLGSLRIACQQPLLRGEKDRERVCVREEKWGEGRGEAGARGE